MAERVSDHAHHWAPVPGPDYDYLPNRQLWHGEKAYVRCAGCGARTWLSREEVSRIAARAAHSEEPQHE